MRDGRDRRRGCARVGGEAARASRSRMDWVLSSSTQRAKEGEGGQHTFGPDEDGGVCGTGDGQGRHGTLVPHFLQPRAGIKLKSGSGWWREAGARQEIGAGVESPMYPVTLVLVWPWIAGGQPHFVAAPRC